MADQVNLDPLGYIEIEWTDESDPDAKTSHKIRWRRPKLREYREFRNMANALGRETQELREELNALLKPVTDYEMATMNGETVEKYEEPDWDRIDHLREAVADYNIPWIQAVDAKMAMGEHLPDIDEWPAWLAGPTFPSQVINHWRKIPKAPGAKGTNLREES